MYLTGTPLELSVFKHPCPLIAIALARACIYPLCVLGSTGVQARVTSQNLAASPFWRTGVKKTKTNRSVVVVGFILPIFTCWTCRRSPPVCLDPAERNRPFWGAIWPLQVSALGQNESHRQRFNCCQVSLGGTGRLLFHGKQFFESHVVGFFCGGGRRVVYQHC